jgi:hypothetical protein
LILSSNLVKCLGKNFAKKQKKLIITPYNPTAEFMAMDMYFVIYNLLKSAGVNCELEKVRIHETTTGWAEFSENQENYYE